MRLKASNIFRQTALSAAVILLTGFPVRAETQPPANSLFFTPEETKQIDILASKDIKKNIAVRPDIHLGAVMYYGPGDWTLWLQGERWTPATDHADLHILDVGPNEVRMTLMGAPDAAAQEITLRPYQTYHTATGKIVEGAAE